ncbi:MAG: response regulator [Sphingobacteriaceae bacterium]
MIKLAIVEDDVEFSQLLRDYLAADPTFSEVQTFESVEKFLVPVEEGYCPHVVLQDINLNGMSGIEAIAVYKKKIPQSRILMNSVLQDSDSVFAAICAGALGYIEKGQSMEKVKEAIITLHQGGSPMSPSIARHVINFFNPTKKFEEDLSPRELEIVQGILDGLSYKMIAEKHHVSLDTVRTHISRIYRKLHINSKGQLIAKFLNKES